jgi:hypothetical protein
MKALVFLVLFAEIMVGPSRAQSIQLRSVTELDCSAYRRQDDGTWIVLRQNTVMRRGNVAREVAPGDDPETTRLSDGTYLRRVLGAICAPTKQ